MQRVLDFLAIDGRLINKRSIVLKTKINRGGGSIEMRSKFLSTMPIEVDRKSELRISFLVIMLILSRDQKKVKKCKAHILLILYYHIISNIRLHRRLSTLRNCRCNFISFLIVFLFSISFKVAKNEIF